MASTYSLLAMQHLLKSVKNLFIFSDLGNDVALSFITSYLWKETSLSVHILNRKLDQETIKLKAISPVGMYICKAAIAPTVYTNKRTNRGFLCFQEEKSWSVIFKYAF